MARPDALAAAVANLPGDLGVQVAGTVVAATVVAQRVEFRAAAMAS